MQHYKRPERELPREVYSNFDHELDCQVASALRRYPGKAFARHAGWNFNASVWHDGNVFVSEVWVYGSVDGYITGESIMQVCRDVCDGWGHE